MPDTLSNLVDMPFVPVGTHCILELYDCPKHLLNDVILIKQALKDAAQSARSTLLDEITYQFNPHGVTALALLAESHISIHTWPEFGYAAADVFTCGRHTEPEKACQHLLETFRARHHSFFQLPRGRFSPDYRYVEATALTPDCLSLK